MPFDPLYCGLITTLICQFGVEILERWKVLHLAPVIRRRTSLEKIAEEQPVSPTRKEQIKTILLKLTRSLDEEGRFRIQRRVSVDIMTGLWEFTLLMSAVFSLIFYPDFWYKALIKMDKEAVHFWVWRQASGSIIFYYLWFLAVNRQGVFPWGTYIHHCFAIMAAALILNGTFLPHALWYGATGTSLAFMVDVLFVWRGSRNNQIKTAFFFFLNPYLFSKKEKRMGCTCGGPFFNGKKKDAMHT
ncbi:hypothetical protein RFI_20702 [Reticulomyxa filosa]|uniref:TLC domain-containing protein n=1 Tax=Reticulomyxa filosa TaxID=46433 RepID=X6MRJ3_RETFI|nr:hypothetical protein RFI_20702 [Reticulomyxa filosa]|eukprot:ETO16638.1 hypothetical protein RFI_20702 [Reticulomyxa filosa]